MHHTLKYYSFYNVQFKIKHFQNGRARGFFPFIQPIFMDFYILTGAVNKLFKVHYTLKN